MEADNAWLKRSESHHRAIKMSLVQQHCPAFIRQFEQQQRGKAEKKAQAGKQQAASKVSTCLACNPKQETHVTAVTGDLPLYGLGNLSRPGMSWCSPEN